MAWLKELGRTLLIVAATILSMEWLNLGGIGDRIRALPNAVLSDGQKPAEASPAVTDSQFQEYLAVLEGMQADHSLSVEQAARQTGITLDELRDIERRVQKDDILVMRARDSLRKKAESLWEAREEASKSTSAAVQ